MNTGSRVIEYIEYTWEDRDGHHGGGYYNTLQPGKVGGGWMGADFGPLPISNFTVTKIHYKGE